MNIKKLKMFRRNNYISNFRNGFKGDELSAVDISKGLKEGNRAFLKVNTVISKAVNGKVFSLLVF